ncbi:MULTISPECIES: hypothetical protein [unclassified Rhizobium]
MKTIAWRATGAVIFLLAVLGSVNLGIWVMDREPPIQFEGARALSATVRPGGSLDVEFPSSVSGFARWSPSAGSTIRRVSSIRLPSSPQRRG